MSSRRRIASRTVVCVLALVGLVLAHVFYWYSPRERPAGFGDGELSSALMAAPQLEVALWIPFPHQNLALLTDSTGDRREFLAAVFRTMGAEAPTLPRFGPLTVPPSSEMLIATDPEGDRLLVACQVYPSVAIFARLAGLVAGNPWLRGGAVEIGGKTAQVRWEGFRWTVSTAGVELTTAAGSPRGTGADPPILPKPPTLPTLAALRAESPPDLLPAGIYTLNRHGDGLEIRSVADESLSELIAPWATEPPPGLVVASFDDQVPGAVQAVGLFPSDGSSGFALPDVVTLTRGGVEPWEVAGLTLLRSLGGGGRSRTVGEWECAAISEGGLDLGVAALKPLDRAIAGPQAGRLELVGALHLEVQRDFLDSLIEVAATVPMVPGRYRRRLEDLRTLSAPLSRFDLAVLAVVRGPSAVVLRLEPGISSH